MQNWNLRHIDKIGFLIFWAVFCALGFKVLKKYCNDLKICFFFIYQKRYQNFTLISNPLKKLLKNIPKKVISNTSLSKSLKIAYFCHIFANNFFWCIFSKLFQRIHNHREILGFLKPKSNLLLKIFFCSYYHFLYTLIANAQETAQKNGNLFLWMCFRILLCNYQRVCITKL